ncbi:hypothetical protein LOD99_7603 [Oopsacas minuta]|uniref:Uncharacterized protein n=1 Tax=Oopsacas minuta TaxID=111878 RepID=A0AAV7JNW2_9METZ|nr:hypothetical protein LOD99_7603 [Oopsacas minuta]
MSQQKCQSVPTNHFIPQNHSQPLSLDNSNYPFMSNPTTPPHLPNSQDIFSSFNPQYLSAQLSPFGFPLLNIMSPFSKQLFPTNGSQLFTMNPQCQFPPGWMQLPQTPPPTTPPLNGMRNSKSSSMHNYIQNQNYHSTIEAREIREIASATCLKAQEDFNMSACTDDIAIALTLCCSATTRLSSVIDDPPLEWDDQIMHQLKSTRKRYAARWRDLYRMFILKKISAQPPSPIPDDAEKKTKVQLNQYIQVSTDVVQKTPKKSPNKPLKSILKKPAKRSSDGVDNRSSSSVSSCSLGALSASSSSHSLTVSFPPPLLRETGTQTSPVNLKQVQIKRISITRTFPLSVRTSTTCCTEV